MVSYFAFYYIWLTTCPNKESSDDASNVLIMPKGKSVAIIKFIALGKVFLENEKGADRRAHFPKIF